MRRWYWLLLSLLFIGACADNNEASVDTSAVDDIDYNDTGKQPCKNIPFASGVYLPLNPTEIEPHQIDVDLQAKRLVWTFVVGDKTYRIKFGMEANDGN